MANASRSDIPKVALLVETARGYGRGLLRGIVRYGRLHGPWSFYVTPGDFEQAVPRMRQWGGTGIVARIETAQVAKAILETRLPTIALDLSSSQLAAGSPLARLSEVASDSRQAAIMAAEHLLERGFTRFGFVGVPDRVWSERRERGFGERIRAAGFESLVYTLPRHRRDRHWERELVGLAQWLADLPKPIGVMACNDDRGRQVLEACREAGILVPEQIAVIGVDNDELLCDLADPPLSSVALNSEAGGYRVAALLDRMMRARVTRKQTLVVEPLHVVVRRSTDIIALDDHDVASALRFLHHNAAGPIGVDDVVRHVQLSRRTLEIRFQKTMGRTVHAEIQRVRLERARQLLTETDLPIPKIAEATGYGSASYLGQVFRQSLGMTPARFRRQIRTG
ncbi:MAG: XylR family transcriptional regulator [Thermoguttaceae bacterium]